MATTCVQHRWTYDAFVSFRGEDIRKSFIDHLLKDFRQKGINVFKDDNQLLRGEEISSQLFKAIEESRFLIVIFSKHYASSSWCLRELVKILECKKTREHKHEVRIIFYDVKPDVVRKQTASYAEAFAEHERLNRKEVAEWKETLYLASNLSGWDLQDMMNGYESKLIDSICKEILKKLYDGPLHVGENLVGLDARVKNMNLLRFVGSSDVHMIGICGVGGIGKTTIAKTIYNIMHTHFEECSFLDDVQGVTKRQGLPHVVMKLINDIMSTTNVKISNIGQGLMVMKQRMASRRILLVLDGVDHHEQLEALAGSRNWFFPGSLIIFTTKDKQLLAHKVDEIYEMEFLDDDEALELFSLYAFREKHPTKDFKEITYHIVKYVQGHPLALKVLGGFLYGESVQVWTSELYKLQTYPNSVVQQVLRLSFDGLDFVQQRVFLDIASYLIGENKEFAATVLDGCNLFADTNINALVNKSLITISSAMSLEMHNLIQSMAREIVREESKSVGGQSRLWIQAEVCDVLSKNKVTEAVEVLVLLLEKSSQTVHMDGKSFACMNNLQILQVCYPELKSFDHRFRLNLWKESKVKYSGTLASLSNELRLFYWHGCPFKFLPSQFYPEKIVAIDLSYSRIKNLWITPKCFNKLKVMTLRHCRHLTKVPDFSLITNIEKIILEGCVNLLEVHPSIGMLKRLVVLNMRNCHNLRSFPCKMEMDSLQVLIISGCSKVDKWPKGLGTIKTLVELHVDQTTIKELPSLLFSLCNLQTLSICGHGGIQSRWWTSIFRPICLLSKLQRPQSFVLPSLTSLCFLRDLNVRNCNISEVSPGSFDGLSCLRRLDVSENNFTSLRASLSQLCQLQTLSICDCKNLEVLPDLPPSVSRIFASGCTSLHKVQKLSITHDRGLQVSLLSCQKLVEKHTVESIVSALLPQGMNSLCNYFNIFFHGNQIPRWFTHQGMGSCVTVDLSSGWCHNTFRGYGTCVVLKKSYRTEGFPIRLKCSVRNFDGDWIEVKQKCGFSYEYVDKRIIGSDVIWLCYWKSNPHWLKAKNFITFSFTCPFFEVQQCGVRLVCDEDIQEGTDSSMAHGLPTPTQDDGVFHPNHELVLRTAEAEDEPPFKKIRMCD